MGPILLADARNPELRAALHALRGDLELIEAGAVPEALRRCTIWLGEPDRLVPLLRAGLRPQWLQSTWAGYRPLLAADHPFWDAPGLTLTRPSPARWCRMNWPACSSTTCGASRPARR